MEDHTWAEALLQDVDPNLKTMILEEGEMGRSKAIPNQWQSKAIGFLGAGLVGVHISLITVTPEAWRSETMQYERFTKSDIPAKMGHNNSVESS